MSNYRVIPLHTFDSLSRGENNILSHPEVTDVPEDARGEISRVVSEVYTTGRYVLQRATNYGDANRTIHYYHPPSGGVHMVINLQYVDMERARTNRTFNSHIPRLIPEDEVNQAPDVPPLAQPIRDTVAFLSPTLTAPLFTDRIPPYVPRWTVRE